MPTYQPTAQYVPYEQLAWGSKLAVGFNPVTYYNARLAAETDPIVRDQYTQALNAYQASAGVRSAQGSNLGLIALGVATANPVLLSAGASQYGQVQQYAQTTGQLPPTTGGLAYQQQVAAGNIQTYIDRRALLAIGAVGATLAGLVYFMRKRG